MPTRYEEKPNAYNSYWKISSELERAFDGECELWAFEVTHFVYKFKPMQKKHNPSNSELSKMYGVYKSRYEWCGITSLFVDFYDCERLLSFALIRVFLIALIQHVAF